MDIKQYGMYLEKSLLFAVDANKHIKNDGIMYMKMYDCIFPVCWILQQDSEIDSIFLC